MSLARLAAPVLIVLWVAAEWLLLVLLTGCDPGVECDRPPRVHVLAQLAVAVTGIAAAIWVLVTGRGTAARALGGSVALWLILYAGYFAY